MIVDDHRVFADAVASRLDAEHDITVAGAVSNAAQAWSLLSEHVVDAVLLDADLGTENGLDLARQLLLRMPEVHILVVSGNTNDARVVEAIRVGVAAWVPKEASIEHLLAALRGACNGETWIPGAILTRVLRVLATDRNETSSTSGLLATLTPRESEVLQCMVDGLSRMEVAERLYLSPNTVRTHVQSILIKFGVHSSLTAVAIARRAGLAPTDPGRRPVPAMTYPDSPSGRDRRERVLANSQPQVLRFGNSLPAAGPPRTEESA